MTPLEVEEGYAQGLAIGKLQRCNQGLGAVGDKADPLLSSASVILRVAGFRNEARDGK